MDKLEEGCHNYFLTNLFKLTSILVHVFDINSLQKNFLHLNLELWVVVVSHRWISSGQSLLHEILQLSLVRRRVTHCGRAHDRSSGVLKLI